MKEYIMSDLYRYTGEISKKLFIKNFIFNYSFRYMMGIRLIKAGGLLKIFGFIIYVLMYNRKICISYKTNIGYGLYIGHGGPIIVNPSTVIGNNVNLSQFTTIGANDGKAAKIGDNCYIGPNVCVVEDVVIGKNVTIGAGSVVTKDIPSNATAAGNYAKVINYKNPGRYINNKW